MLVQMSVRFVHDVDYRICIKGVNKYSNTICDVGI